MGASHTRISKHSIKKRPSKSTTETSGKTLEMRVLWALTELVVPILVIHLYMQNNI